MRKPIYSWTNFLTRLGLKLVKRPVGRKASRHRSLRLEHLQARELLTGTEWIIDNYPDNVAPEYVETGTGWILVGCVKRTMTLALAPSSHAQPFGLPISL